MTPIRMSLLAMAATAAAATDKADPLPVSKVDIFLPMSTGRWMGSVVAVVRTYTLIYYVIYIYILLLRMILSIYIC